jgi:tetratricopeptide (TPR) repeat protein
MPQHTKRTRFRRKDLRQPDEFKTLTSRAAEWVRGHQQLGLGVLGGVAAIFVLGLIVSRVGAARSQAAADAFRSAYATFQAGKFGESAEAFGALVHDYPRTPFGRLAGLYRGHALARQGNAGDAATAYGEYLASSPDTYLRQEALTGLGHSKEAAGDRGGALAAYDEAAVLEGPYKTEVLFAAARLEEAGGQADQARERYGRLLKEALDPDLRAQVLAKLPPGFDASGQSPAEP